MSGPDPSPFDTAMSLNEAAETRVVQEGDRLTCTNPGCGCRLRIEVPCPHAEIDYRCACGHALRGLGE